MPQPTDDRTAAYQGNSSEVNPVEVLAEEFAARLRRGERPSIDEYLAGHPDLADGIRAVFPALLAVERLKSEPEAAAVERVGDYRIIREVGRGGMGIVYEAEQLSLQRRVALKILPLDAAKDSTLAARFRREAKAAAGLHHTNIVPVFEVGQEGDVMFYAMQLIDGRPLDEVAREVQRLRRGETPRAGDTSPLSSAVSDHGRYCRNVAALVAQVAEGLAYAHARDVLHRDIKPSNLLLDAKGIVWISDFGLAHTGDVGLTETGNIVGTLRYMAPERFRGQCDARADVYALGLTLYELLTLRQAFAENERALVVEQILNGDVAPPRQVEPAVPPDLETIVLKAIDKEPSQRYASASAFADDLQRFLDDQPILARPIGPGERLWRWGHRNPVIALLIIALFVTFGTGTVINTVMIFWAFASQHEAEVKSALASQKADEAKQERDEAERQRDEVKKVNQQLRATKEKLELTLYAAKLAMAQNAWEAHDDGRVQALLEETRPAEGEDDPRGFEWHYWNRRCNPWLTSVTLRPTLPQDDRGVNVTTRLPPALDLSGRVALFQRRSRDGRCGVEVFDVESGKRLFAVTPTDQAEPLHGFASVDPQGRRVALLMQRRDNPGYLELSVRDLDGKVMLTRRLDGVRPPLVGFPALSPGGSRVALVTTTKRATTELSVVEVESGKALLDRLPFDDRFLSFLPGGTFSPDGVRLAFVCRAKGSAELVLLDLVTSKEARRPLRPERAAAIEANRVLTVDGVEELDSGKLILPFSGSSPAWLSPDGRLLAVTNRDQSRLTIHDADTGAKRVELRGSARRFSSVAFLGKSVRTLSASGTAETWSLDVGANPALVNIPRPKLGGVFDTPPTGWDTSVDRDGNFVVGDNLVAPFTGMTPRASTLSLHDSKGGRIRQVSLAGGLLPFGASLSPDGSLVAALSLKGGTVTLQVFNLPSGTELRRVTFPGRINGTAVAWSDDGRRLAAVVPGGTGKPADVALKAWDVAPWRERLSVPGRLPVGAGLLGGVAFRADGERLAASVGGATAEVPVGVWNVSTGEKVASLDGAAAHGPRSLAFSPDGKAIAVVRYLDASGGLRPNAGVYLHDAETGRLTLALNGAGQTATAVTFHPDGKRLATASMLDSGGQVQLWGVETGRELLRLETRGPTPWLGFDANGGKLSALGGPPGDAELTTWDARPISP